MPMTPQPHPDYPAPITWAQVIEEDLPDADRRIHPIPGTGLVRVVTYPWVERPSATPGGADRRLS